MVFSWNFSDRGCSRYLFNDQQSTTRSHYDSTAPTGYTVYNTGDWTNYLINQESLPNQGWKIHLSSHVDSAPELLARVKPPLFSESVCFKHISSRSGLLRRNSRGERGDLYGKFVTIYPPSLDRLVEIVEILLQCSEGFSGPKILTDLQLGSSNVYVRYGVFRDQTAVDPRSGRERTYLVRPDGEREWEERGATLKIPDWAPTNSLVTSLIKDRDLRNVRLPFTEIDIIRSNTRGLIFSAIYCGKRVFVKEARRGSDVDQHGRDAVDHLNHEFMILEGLSVIKEVPDPIDILDVGASTMFVSTFLEGVKTLREYVVENLGRPYLDIDSEGYANTMSRTLLRIDECLTRIHREGYSHHDLSPDNILLDSAGNIFIVDWEAATDQPGEEDRWIYTQGFSAPRSVVGPAADRFALWRIGLFCFTARSPVLDIFPGHVDTLENYVMELFGRDAWRVVKQLGDQFARGPGQQTPFRPVQGPITGSDLVTGAKHINTWERANGFAGGSYARGSGPASFGSGETGYAVVLQRLGYPHASKISRWELPDDFDLSLWAGVAGLLASAPLLDDAVPIDIAGAFAKKVLRKLEDPHFNDHSLATGVGGWLVGLTVLAQSTGHAAADAASQAAIDWLLERGGQNPFPETQPPGLLYGWSGTIAVLLGIGLPVSDRICSLIGEFLRFEEENLHVGPGYTLQALSEGRLMPYLGIGSGGVLWAREAVRRAGLRLPVTDVDEQLLRAVAPGVYGLPSLMYGASGLQLLAKYQGRKDQINDYDREISIGCAGIEPSGTVVLGEGADALSNDFTYGAAGVLWALATSPSKPLDFLPFGFSDQAYGALGGC